jgi:hypothetical protein
MNFVLNCITCDIIFKYCFGFGATSICFFNMIIIFTPKPQITEIQKLQTTVSVKGIIRAQTDKEVNKFSIFCQFCLDFHIIFFLHILIILYHT